MSSYVNRLILNNFRNHEALDLVCNSSPVAIIGQNGIGKTNILEALSFLSPGRGLRSAQIKDIGRFGIDTWTINAEINKDDSQFNIGLGCRENKKIIKIDHKVQSRQIELTKIVNLIWLTPQMNTIFLGNRKNRLNFFDRIVFSFDWRHAKNISEYENTRHERIRLLKNRILDKNWLSILEAKMAKNSTEIAKARLKIIGILQPAIDAGPFSYIQLIIDGKVEKLVTINDDSEKTIMKILHDKRNIDMLSGRTNYGTHTSDFNAYHRNKNIRIALCSTGEQKLALITIILAAIKKDTILLLDDIISNLDDRNRAILLSAILKAKCQAWITDTNTHNFDEVKNKLKIFSL